MCVIHHSTAFHLERISDHVPRAIPMKRVSFSVEYSSVHWCVRLYTQPTCYELEADFCVSVRIELLIFIASNAILTLRMDSSRERWWILFRRSFTLSLFFLLQITFNIGKFCRLCIQILLVRYQVIVDERCVTHSSVRTNRFYAYKNIHLYHCTAYDVSGRIYKTWSVSYLWERDKTQIHTHSYKQTNKQTNEDTLLLFYNCYPP